MNTHQAVFTVLAVVIMAPIITTLLSHVPLPPIDSELVNAILNVIKRPEVLVTLAVISVITAQAWRQ